MEKKIVLYLHGFGSSAKAAKARYLEERFNEVGNVQFLSPDFNPTEKDFEYLTVTGMVNRLSQYLIDRNVADANIVASSLGCLVALHYVSHFGGVQRLLLLAPALSFGSLTLDKKTLEKWEREGTTEFFHYKFSRNLPLRYDFYLDGLRYAEQIPPPSPIHILHGRNDETISIEESRKYAAKYPGMVTLTELESDHTLQDQLGVIWDHVSSLL